MLSIQQLKSIKQLHSKKGRLGQKKFIIEGKKIIQDLLEIGYPLNAVYYNGNELGEIEIKCKKKNIPFLQIPEKQIEQISVLQQPQAVLGISKIVDEVLSLEDLKNQVTFVLDGISDPGNLGTIIRLADWFGIKNIICSKNTVELHNPKVIQASMGSFCNVKLHYQVSLPQFFSHESFKKLKLPLIGASLNGKEYTKVPPQSCMLVLGSEAHGISAELNELLDTKILIPGNSNKFAESLNVSVAASLLASYFCKV